MTQYQELPRQFHDIPSRAIKIPIPDVTQIADYSCGAVSFEGIVHYYGVDYGEEHQLCKDLHTDHRTGTNPEPIIALARHLGFATIARERWTSAQLRRALDEGDPLMLSLQAYGDKKRQLSQYKDSWSDGHWVIAIGYDDEGIFFEDTSLQAVRGYMRDKDLMVRWHDKGAHGKRLYQYAIRFHLPGGKNQYEHVAQLIP
jgi:predicted double-glycine peptidase